MELYRLILYFIFGVLPSLIWLFYYLQKDINPEPKRMIIKVFLLGMLATIPALIIQIFLSQMLSHLPYPIISNLIKWFFVIALTEELSKYLVVRLFVFNSDALDEPLDIMLYMVVAALGFAALENILYLFSPINGLSFDTILKTTITISFMRLIGATFLHTLCSALIGYFLVLAALKSKNKIKLTLLGIFLATLLHGLYNFSIITLSAPLNFVIPIMIIIGLAIFIFYDFDEVKKIKSICRI